MGVPGPWPIFRAHRGTIGRNRLCFSFVFITVDIHRIWYRAKADLLSRFPPFNGVIGPMGAIIAMMSDIAWNMISPTYWMDIDQSENPAIATSHIYPQGGDTQ